MAAPNSILAQYLIASLGVAFTLFTFFTMYKIISLLCLSSSGSPTPTRVLQSENSTLQVETGGVPVEAVNSLPVIELTEAMGKGVKASDCAVCLGEFAKEDSLGFLPNCSHYFHIDCIDSWLKANSNCPLCRVKVSCELSKSGPSSSSVEAENSERTNQEGAVVDIHLLALETRESRDSGAAPVEVR